MKNNIIPFPKSIDKINSLKKMFDFIRGHCSVKVRWRKEEKLVTTIPEELKIVIEDIITNPQMNKVHVSGWIVDEDVGLDLMWDSTKKQWKISKIKGEFPLDWL